MMELGIEWTLIFRAAALVTGNTIVYKPSGFTPVIGHLPLQLFRAAGLPAGVFNYLPGRGSVIGDRRVDSPRVSLIGFTGSLETGQRILERAARVHPGQANVKRVICERGGKNAIIVDDDADLDEPLPAVMASAFGYQGQSAPPGRGRSSSTGSTSASSPGW